MDKKTKRLALILIIFIIIMGILSSAGLSQLTFQPGMPLPELDKGNFTLPSAPEQPGISLSVNTFIKVLFLVLLASAVVFILYKIIRTVRFRKIPAFLLSLLAVCLGLTVILLLFMYLLPKSGKAITSDLPLPLPEPRARTPLGPAPGFLSWFMGFGLAGLAILLGVRILSSKRSTSRESTIRHLGQVAENAREAILKGENLKDVIIRCYRQMTLVLQQQEGLEREESMTVEEFGVSLTDAGAPPASVDTLTRLFEAVRYGNWQPDHDSEEEAIRSFENIIKFFKEKNRRKHDEQI